jgi:hypothetical protein
MSSNMAGHRRCVKGVSAMVQKLAEGSDHGRSSDLPLLPLLKDGFLV